MVQDLVITKNTTEDLIIEKLDIDWFWWNNNVTVNKCWEWAGCRFLKPFDYGCKARRINGKLITGKIHRIAWVLFNGKNIPLGLNVMHKCDNPPCYNPAHLAIGTHLMNMQDMVLKGRQAKGAANGRYTKPDRTARGDRSGRRLHPDSWYGVIPWSVTHKEQMKLLMPRGEDNYISKLDDSKVIEIRRLHNEEGITTGQLGKLYGVERAAVRAVLLGRTWSHIPMPNGYKYTKWKH